MAGRRRRHCSKPADWPSISAGLSRSKTSILQVMPGRKAGADRPQRLGQEHPRQLPLPAPCATTAARIIFDGRRLDRLPAYQRTRLGLARSFQLPKPFRTMSLVDNLRIPLLYAVNARPGHAPFRRGDRRALRWSSSPMSGSPTRPDGCRAT